MHVGPARRPRVFWFLVENSLLLLTGAVAALVWANLDLASYSAFTHALHFAVNDIGMVFFFAIAAKEVFEATLPGGSLSSARRAALPLLAAVGGMAGPALLYLAQVAVQGRPELSNGWAIPCATDIAFSYLVARFIFGVKHAAVPFLLMLAIADDALGLLILALFYPSGPVRPLEAIVLVAMGMGVGFLLRRRGVLNFWPYVLLGGGLSWIGLFRGGVHPALALVPIIPMMPHARRDLGLYAEREELLPDSLNRFEHWWKTPVEIILFFFGLVNAGVPLANAGAGTWIVLVAILLGKPLGIGLFTLAGRVMSLELPGVLRWQDVIVVGLVAAIGFTVALFFATAAFPPGDLLDQTKMGALMSLGAAGVSIAAARILGVGRFARTRRV
jgi:NhaA family Na+:H+ antiporter